MSALSVTRVVGKVLDSRSLLCAMVVAVLCNAVASGDEKGDAHEPNDDFKTAKPVKLNETSSFSIMPAGDSDFFKVAVKQAGYLRMTHPGRVKGIEPLTRRARFCPSRRSWARGCPPAPASRRCLVPAVRW